MKKKTKNEIEQYLIPALKALKAQTGIGHATPKMDAKYIGVPRQVDGHVELDDPLGPYAFEVKTHITPARVGAIAAQIKRLPFDKPTILVTDYITAPVAERLRELDIQFVDTTGNAFLRQAKPKVLIWMVGNKPPRQVKTPPMTAFRTAGMRVLFALLARPYMLELGYREIAAAAGVALGTVANTMEELIDRGYVINTDGGREFVDQRRLRDRWVELYPQELRPKLLPQRFRTAEHDWWRTRPLQWFEKHDAWLGGEAAAAVITRYLKPAVATVYGVNNLEALARDLKLVRDPDGNVEIIRRFWEFEENRPHAFKQRLCPPLLTYADLLATGDARNVEVAGILEKDFVFDE